MVLDEDEELVSFDVTSLYTNVPVKESITVCADLLYSGNYKLPPIDKQTFIELAEISSCNVLMLTHDGYYKQTDGLAMGSPPASHLANGWLSKYDPIIRGNAKIYDRYMDDIIREIKKVLLTEMLETINNLHPKLKFTVEREVDGKISFLDMLIIHEGSNLSSTWYNKPTDTGLILNFHALAPKRYKRSVVTGFVYRIFRACSSWRNFDVSVKRAKRILEGNQYPPEFYEPIIRETISNLIQDTAKKKESNDEMVKKPRKMVFIQYRGKCTEDYARALHKIKAPCTVVMTLRKLRTILPSLKPAVEKILLSGLVYKIVCPGCKACYVGQTSRHVTTRFQEHLKPFAPVYKHVVRKCDSTIDMNDVEILKQSSRGEVYLETLEALFIEEIKPTINTKDEYRSRAITIRI